MENTKLHWSLSYGIITLTILLGLGVALFFIYQPDPVIDYSIDFTPAAKAAVYGDSRTNHDIHQKIVNGIKSKNPQHVLNTGDLVEDGEVADQWATFNKITEELRAKTKFYAAVGNHEKNSQLYFDNFVFPGNERWYTFDAGKARFFILDYSASLAVGSEQYDWLEKQLKESGTKKKIVALHYPIFNSGEHELDELGLKTTLIPLLEKYKVSAVFSGHDHDYERSSFNNIYFFVTGGGGAPLYTQTRQIPESQKFISAYNYVILKITKSKIKVIVYDIDGNAIDQIEIK